MPWSQVEDAFKHGFFRREITQGKKLRESAAVEARPETGKLEQSLDFRSKAEAVPKQCIIERLDAQAIARAEKSSGAQVPDSKCEHPPKVVNAILAILLIHVQDRFGVTMGSIMMASLFK